MAGETPRVRPPVDSYRFRCVGYLADADGEPDESCGAYFLVPAGFLPELSTVGRMLTCTRCGTRQVARVRLPEAEAVPWDGRT